MAVAEGMTEIEEALADLETRFPAWDVWTVPRATVRGPTWCARRKGEQVASFGETSTDAR
jgi:hypothetical protein